VISGVVLQKYLPYLLKGMGVSLQITAVSSVIGILLGTLLAVGSRNKHSFITIPISIYTTILRGTPMLIQILFMAYVLPQIGINIPLLLGAMLALGLNSAAYVSNIIRSGIASVGVGQIEAARVLGLSNIAITRYIVLPQAIRAVFPALGNELITLMKDSALASTVGVFELTQQGRYMMSCTHNAMGTYTVVGLLYLVMTTILSGILALIERRMNQHARS